MQTVKTGKIVKLIHNKNYGFLATDEGTVFFHAANVREHNFGELSLGDVVAYHAELGPKGLRATMVSSLIQDEVPLPSSLGSIGVPYHGPKYIGLRNVTREREHDCCIEFLLAPGTADSEEIGELFCELSKLFILMGGTGVQFATLETRQCPSVGVSN